MKAPSKVALPALVAAVLAVLPAVVWLANAADRSVPTVDFANVVGEAQQPPRAADSQRPVMHIAVAAMISPRTMRSLYDDLLRIIAARAGRRAVFVQRQTYAEVNHMLERRQVDVAFVCSGPYVLGHDKFGLELLVVPQVQGERRYRAYLIARRDSEVASLEDLRGRTFAFTDPDSNTGSLVVRHMLALRGQEAGSFFGETFFTHAHDNSILAVGDGMADGAAVDSLIYDFLASNHDPLVRKTKVISRSPPYGIPPVVVHPSLNRQLKERLRAIFLGLHQDADAVPLLRKLHIERFATADDSLYESVREMQRWIAHGPLR